MTILFEFFTILPLGFAIFLLARNWRRFTALRLILAALPFIAVARAAEACLKWRLGAPSSGSAEALTLSTISDFADVLGVLLLVAGFIRTLRSQIEASEKIERLEVLLPLCAKCKKFRTEDGDWKPIEEYITTRGGADAVTHGYCPECAEALMQEVESYRAGR